MNSIFRFALTNCRVVQKTLPRLQPLYSRLNIISKMSQKSITSFFTKTPIKTIENKIRKDEDTSPINEQTKAAKRQRIDSSEDETSAPPATKPNRQKTPNSETKKTPKTKSSNSNIRAESKKSLDANKSPAIKKEKKSPATKKDTNKLPVVKKDTIKLSENAKNPKRNCVAVVVGDNKNIVEKKSSENGKSLKESGVAAVVKDSENKMDSAEDESEGDEIDAKSKDKIKDEPEISDADSPIKLKLNGSKRNRLASSSSEEESPKPKRKEKKAVKKIEKIKKSSSASESEDLEESRSSVEDVKPTMKMKSEKSSPVKKPASAIMNFFTTTKEKKETKEAETSELDYNPTKSKYHPIKDACWSRGDKVPYLALAKTLEAIEGTSARLKIVEILSNFLRSVMVLTPEDLLPSVYMCLNKLAPAYESLELGVADTYLMKAIAQSTGRTLAQVRVAASKAGDLGLVAEQCRASQRMMFQPAPLNVRGVFAALRDVAKMTGQASMSKKVSKIQTMFVACRHSEARYFIRSLAGKLRVGLAEQSVLQALAQACTATPPLQKDWPPAILDASKGLSPEQFKANIEEQALIIKTTYCECPNYDKIIPVILEYGIAELPNHCRLTPGIPLKPMLAHPTKGISEVFQRFENLKFTCEWKYDGERAQIHVPSTADGKADLSNSAIFSRNQENNTTKYPDVLGRLATALKPSVASCVLDCEAVAWDKEKKQILPFQILSTRKRKDAAVEDIKVQVCLFMFDLLYLNGEALVTRPLAERRELLREHFNVVEGEWLLATSKDCFTLDEVQEFLEESVRGSCEGLMVKTLAGKDATYEIAKRSRNWLKLKKDYLDGVGDTLDIVVIGGYHGRGKRTGHYGGFLLACYDPDAEEYQSICKIGTGFTEDDLAKHSGILNEHKIDGPRNYYRYDDSHEPDVWFAPACVWEVLAADLSLSPAHRAAMGLVNPDKGISLRFPRFIREREDKTPEEATSARQVADIYLNQDVVKNQSTGAGKNIEDDFY